MVRAVPFRVAGPVTVKVIGRPEVELAERVMGATPYLTGEVGCVKVMDCGAVDMVKDPAEVAVREL
jgi:hypothetical protein